ncbi:MAG: metallophosphoesterase family protein [Candidatus Binataceae bacterium]
MGGIKVSILNQSQAVTDAEVGQLVSVLKTQLARDFTPAWGLEAELALVPHGGKPAQGTWWLVILDHSDQAGVMGIHDVTDEGLPLAKVFAGTLKETHRSWTVATSHELLEMLVDPGVNLAACVDNGNGTTFYAYEICDPCERDDYGYEIDGIEVADFVFPAWFEPFRKPSQSRFDQCCHITCWLQLLPGGYATVLDPSRGNGWHQVYADGTPASQYAAPRVGSRRHRRRMPRAHWRRSSVATSETQTGAKAGRTVPILASNPSGGRRTIALRHSDGTHRNVLDEIDEAITKISHSSERGLANSESVLRSLREARKKLSDRNLLNGEIPEDPSVALLLSAIAGTAQRHGAFGAFELEGFDQYGTLDIDWITHYLASRNFPRVPFPHHERFEDTIVPINDKVTIAIAGDWGTGLPSSRKIAQQMIAPGVAPDHTIHLGDVYYAGTPDDVRNNFLNTAGCQWPRGSSPDAPSFALNSNHEMYAGGQGYLGVTLKDAQFQAQKGLSYFALENQNWLIIGLDTAYFSPDPLFQLGLLDETYQLPWLKELTARARGGQTKRRIILLSHHDAVDVDRRTNEVEWKHQLWDQVVNAMDGVGPDYWYWGHVHAGIVFKPITTPNNGSVLARCVGHGGIPFEPYKTAVGLGDGTIGAEWVENRLAHDPDEDKRALNGFVVVRLDGPNISGEFRDEDGNVQWPKP